MPTLCRIALADLRFPRSPEESVELARQGIAEAASRGAQVVCVPESFVPGYRCPEHEVPAPDAGFLEIAWRAIGKAPRTLGFDTSTVLSPTPESR